MGPHSLTVMHAGGEAAISGQTYLLRAGLHLVVIGALALSVFLGAELYGSYLCARRKADDPGQ